jgi:outer membrane lipopolysaccharide assembly protein LptE/RlpB
MLLKTSPRRLLQLSTHRHTHLPPTLPLSTLRSSLTHSFTSTSQQPQRQLETKVVDDTQTVPDKLLGTRQELEQRRKEFEEKYAHQLKRKMEE